MDETIVKQSALLVLIEESTLLSYAQKLALLEEFPTFNQEQIDALGDLLAMEEQLKEEFAPEIQMGVDDVLARIVSPDPVNTNAVYVGVGKPTN